MEFFTDVVTRQPVKSLTLAEGETKVLRLKKPAPGASEVSTYCQDNGVAAGDRVVRLQDPTKHSLNADAVHTDGYYSYRIPTIEVTDGDSFLVQVTGVAAGQTELIARLNTLAFTAYAHPVPVTVTSRLRRLSFGVLFADLWRNHPYSRNPHIRVCDGPAGAGQCMMRFCDTLKECTVSLKGLTGDKCGKSWVAGHLHHFSNPYDFEKWKPLSMAHVWKAAKPFQPEPMPGVAALRFIRSRWKGVVVLYHYFDRGVPEGKVVTKGDMYGGHIDLWDGTMLGNDIPSGETHDGGFYRADKIAFWPMERV